MSMEAGVALNSTVLLPEVGSVVMEQCSRYVPSPIEGYWQPTKAVIANLERKISAVSQLRAVKCCLIGARIRDPRTYALQYIGVVVAGQKLVYINAFRARKEDDLLQPVVICDGGSSAWGALYDPEKEVFFDLAVNGEA